MRCTIISIQLSWQAKQVVMCVCVWINYRHVHFWPHTTFVGSYGRKFAANVCFIFSSLRLCHGFLGPRLPGRHQTSNGLEHHAAKSRGTPVQQHARVWERLSSCLEQCHGVQSEGHHLLSGSSPHQGSWWVFLRWAVGRNVLGVVMIPCLQLSKKVGFRISFVLLFK